MVDFSFVPDTRVPGAYAEIDNTRAVRGLVAAKQRILVMGQRLATGTVAEGVVTTTLRAEQAAEFFGRGSMLHRMFKMIEANNLATETKAIALDDLVAGVQATGDIDFTGSTATEAGTLNVYIGGQRIRAGVASGDTAGTIATAVAAAITAATDVSVTAVANVNQVDLTARHKGENGNDIDVRLNYFDGDATPAGVTAVVTAMSGGSGNPDIAGTITAVAGEHYDYFIMPWTDVANISALETELATRFQPPNALAGHAFSAKAGTQGNLTTYGNARNSPHVSIMGMDSSPTPPEEIAAAFGARAASNLELDPARPLQTLPLYGVRAPAVADRFTFQEADILLNDGIATSRVQSDGTVLIERAITTYQLNPQSAPDPSYLDVTTLATVIFLRDSWRTRMLLKFPRHKLASDGTRFGPGQAIATPSILRGETIALAREWEFAGLVENIDQFKNDLIVERDQGDVNRVNFLIPPDIVNQLRVLAANFQYVL